MASTPASSKEPASSERIAPSDRDAPTASELRDVLGRLVRRLRVEHRIPLAHGLVLSRLDREGPQTTSHLAKSERVRPQSMAQTVRDMEQAGFLSRAPDPNDRRCVLIGLTDHGRTELERDRAGRESWLAEAIETELDAAERELLGRAVGILERLTHFDPERRRDDVL